MSPEDAADTPPELTAAVEPAAEEAPAAPKRRRAPRKKVVEAEPAPAPTAADFAAPEAAALFGRADAAPAAPEPAAPPPAAQAAAEEAPVAETAGAADRADAAAGAEGEAPAGEDGGPRRSRNRRRGRRGGERDRADRPPRVEGAEGAEGADTTDVDAAAEGGDAEAPAAESPPPRLPPADVGELFAGVLAGTFDAEVEPEEGEAAAPTKRVLAAEPDAPKLHKVLAQAGVGSRRDMEQMILEGRITVNGEPAHIGQRISFGDRIAVGGKPVRFRIAPPPPRVLAYHKPAGEVVTHDDPQQRPTVFRRLPRLQQGKWQSVGRLDINTEGLLLFTNSGELANQLMHPRFGVEREYAVRSLGALGEESKAKLLEGVEIDGQRCAFKSITDGGGEGANHWYRCVITEGRNREVRKLFETCGHAVSRLIRIRYGCVVLPKGLKRGVFVDLDDQDVKALRRLGGSGQPGQGEARGDRGPADRGGDRDGQRNKRRGKRGRGGPRPDGAPEGDRPLNIPNPLQQTYDKRALQQDRRQQREINEDGPIPNPLQQTYDKRALQQERRQPPREFGEDGPIPNPLQQTYDKRFTQKQRPLGVAGGAGRRGGGGKKGPGGERQPDPLQTAVGYIGGDAFLRKGQGRGGKGGGGGSAGSGGGRRGRGR